ncbi:MAG: methyltransferase domain-containing protein [Acidobacteriota bacterium]|nr:methyltransferase domain-containing protein [Acidobacteriota bacterium]
MKLKHERGDIVFAPGKALELEFDMPFDCIVATEIIEHVAHPDEFLKQLSSLVAPGGYVVLTTPNGAYFRNDLPRFSDCLDPSVFESVQFKPNADGHIFLLWPDEIRRMVEQSGFRLERFDVFTTPLTNGHVKLEFLLWVLPRRAVFAIEGLAARLPDAIRHRLMVQTSARFRRA